MTTLGELSPVIVGVPLAAALYAYILYLRRQLLRERAREREQMTHPAE